MALQAQIHLDVPPSSSEFSGSASDGPSSLSYTIGSGSTSYDRNPPHHHYASMTSSNQMHRNKPHRLLSFPFGTNQHNAWLASTSQHNEGSVHDTTSATTLSSISGGTLAPDAPSPGAYGRSASLSSALLNVRSEPGPPCSAGQSVHVTTTSMAPASTSSSEAFHHDYLHGAYATMDFRHTPAAEYKTSQTSPSDKAAPMPVPFSQHSLLHPATSCSIPTQPAVSALGQSQSSIIAPGITISAAGPSDSSARTSIASTSSTADTPLTPITPVTPVSTTAYYSNNVSAPSNATSGGMLPMRASHSLPTLGNGMDVHENYMGIHPDIKERMQSISLPTPTVTVNGNNNHGFSLHEDSHSISGLSHFGSGMTTGSSSAPLTRHFSLPSLPHEFRSTQHYSASADSHIAPIHQAGFSHQSKGGSLNHVSPGSTDASHSGVTLGLSIGANAPSLDHNLSQGPADLSSMGQRPLPSGPSPHSHLAFGLSPYDPGRPMMDHGMSLGMNMNMGLGSGAFSPGTSTTSVAAATAAAMAMGTGHTAGRAGNPITTSSATSKKHKCKVCDKRFTRPSSLQTHMYSHTGEKPFTCDFDSCGRQFSVVSNLRRHKKVHKGVTPPSQAGRTSPSVSR